MIKKHWWKGLGVALVIYAITAGILVPLKPGVLRVTPQSADAGTSVNLAIHGYNTVYPTDESQIRAWLKLDSAIYTLQAAKIEVFSRKSLELQFNLPLHLPGQALVAPATVIIDDAQNGTHLLPDAVFIRQLNADAAAGDEEWQSDQLVDLNITPGFNFPFRNILKETIRNTYFHVSLWFAMLFLFIGGVYYSVRYLRFQDLRDDAWAANYTRVGILFGLLGLGTGMVWAQFTWGAFWSGDVKQVMTAIALLIYIAYIVLRNSFDDEEKRARLGASYNIFAFAVLIPLIYIVPRMTESLHPGAGGNPAFGSDDLDNTMRMIFYPAIIGWTLIGYWISNIGARMKIVEDKHLDVI